MTMQKAQQIAGPFALAVVEGMQGCAVKRQAALRNTVLTVGTVRPNGSPSFHQPDPMRTHLLTPCAVALCLTNALHAQPPTHQGVVYNLTGSTASVVNGVAADADGNLIITGWRSDPLDLGGTVHPDGTGAIFLAKSDGQGTELWSKVSGSADQQGNHKGMGVAVDGNGNIYNCGWVFAVEQATFDGTTLPAGTAGYVAKYNASGTLLWVKDFAGGVNAIAVDGNGVPFINLGDATIEKLDPANGLTVASGTGGGDLQNVGYHNIVVHNGYVFAQWGNKITKYTMDLTPVWSTPLTKPFGAESYRISVDDDGNVWATFYAVFGTVSLGGTDYTSFPAGYIYHLSGGNGDVLGCTSPGAFKYKKVFNTGTGDLLVQGDFAFNQPNVVKYDGTFTAVWSVPTFDTKDIEKIGPDCFILGGQHSADITLSGTTYPRPNGSGSENAMAAYLCAGTVGVAETAVAPGATLAPNPATSTLRVHLGGSTLPATVRLTTLDGRTVLEQGLGGQPTVQLAIGHLAPGIYLLRADNGTLLGRFMKE
jgi:hypothetical protein